MMATEFFRRIDQIVDHGWVNLDHKPMVKLEDGTYLLVESIEVFAAGKVDPEKIIGKAALCFGTVGA